MNIFDRFSDSIKLIMKQVEHGQVIILLGQRGRGKSETVKSLCKKLSGHKYVVRLNENLCAIHMNPDDKKDYTKLPRCKVIEDTEDIIWESGIYIFEDFPIFLPPLPGLSFYHHAKGIL